MGDCFRGARASAGSLARRLLQRVLLNALWLTLAALVSRNALAAPATSSAGISAECSTNNLLALARVEGGPASARLAKVLTDHSVVREGSPWPDESAVVVLREPLVFDLGAVTSLRQLYLQVDADQAFGLELSLNGADWTRLSVGASSTASGLVSRSFNLGLAEARFVKLVPTSEPPTLTLTELSVSCRHDAQPRRGLVSNDPPRAPPGSSWLPGLLSALTGLPAISPEGASLLKLALVAASLGLLGFELRRGRRWALPWVLIGVAAVGVYLNLGAYRYPEFVHDHDVFHYFVGAKYFPELGYDKIYQCSAVAEADAGFEQRVRLRAQRDLRSNALVPGSEVLADRDVCRHRFSPDRWRAFKRDVAYFADGRSVADWHRILRDHGFNGSPTWVALARTVAGHLPANEATIGHRNAIFAGRVGSLDPLLLLLALVTLNWAFGLRTAALVAIVFACNPLADFAWIGGGFLREAWLVALAIGISLLKRHRYFLGGASLALSMLLQLLPVASLMGAVLAGIVAALALTWRRGRPSLPGATTWLRAALNAIRAEGAMGRLLGGAALTVVLLVPLSAWSAGEAHAWSAFAANTAKHAATPSGNLVGLGTLLSFRSATNVDALFDPSVADPFERTRAARVATRRSMRPIQALIGVGACGALVFGLRRRRGLWWAGALGLCLVPLWLDTTCYYAAWLCIFALVAHDDERLGLAILGTVLALLIVRLTIARLGLDMAIASAILLVGVAAVLALVLRRDNSSDEAAAT